MDGARAQNNSFLRKVLSCAVSVLRTRTFSNSVFRKSAIFEWPIFNRLQSVCRVAHSSNILCRRPTIDKVCPNKILARAEYSACIYVIKLIVDHQRQIAIFQSFKHWYFWRARAEIFRNQNLWYFYPKFNDFRKVGFVCFQKSLKCAERW